MKRLLLVPLFLCVFSLAAHALSAKWVDVYRDVIIHHLVLVETQDAYCTGEMVGPGKFLTAAHCVTDQGFLVDHFGHKWMFDVVKRSEGFDLALLSSICSSKTPMTIATFRPLDGSTVYAVGYSDVFQEPMVNFIQGVLLGEMHAFLVVKPGYRHGYSGGPLLNEEGELVGVNVRSDQKYGASVPLEAVKYFLH